MNLKNCIKNGLDDHMKVATLGYLIKEDQVLLTKKKRGFGKGLYNGFGGKVEKGESFEQALIREAYEEIGVIPTEYTNVGKIIFFDNEEIGFFVKVYLITKWKGVPKESEEVNPVWFTVDKIPYNQMWGDDKYWLPKVLEGKKIKAEFWFENLFGDRPKMIKHNIRELEK